MKENLLRRILTENRPSIGTRLWSAQPFFTEAAGASGNYDYIEFIAEYAPFDQYDLENIVRAAELHGLGSMIKIDFQNRAWVAQKAIASGFQGILFTDSRTAEDVEESVRMVKSDRPSSGGTFGYPNRRYIGFQPYLGQMEHCDMVDQVVLAFMVEKAETMENLDRICSVPGVDMVQFGPSDYAMSLGWNTSGHKQEVEDAQKRMIETALKHDVQPRVEIFDAPEAAKPYIALGVKHFCFGDEVKTLQKFWNQEGAKMKALVKGD
ncbi:MAG: 2,4-dihydroxyhept-2-ene-1,7-dioic acid aldolase [Treponema sp.]|jgi:2-keto-3-deoxy-L-rhamnonate aldolase RhmA|nr:2,4-dihydroxyhept-2-ene-1,7-dioic acid aldolase [Treponema sp.]